MNRKDKRYTPLDDYFSNRVKIRSHWLRLRLLADGIFEHRCVRCLRTEWEGQPIPLELNHISGNRNDNSLTNLEMLCPNCHALTPHYKGRGCRGRKYKTHCKRGHERRKENLYPHGGCKACKMEYDAGLRQTLKNGTT